MKIKNLYCPLCGDEMEIASKDLDHIDCEWQNEDGDWHEDINDESIHWHCPTNKCFGKYSPLIQHAAPMSDVRQRVEEHFSGVGASDKGLLWLGPSEKSWSLTMGSDNE